MQPATQESPDPIDGRRRAQLVLFAGLTALSIDLCLPAFPAMAVDLGATPAEVQRTLSAYLLGVAVGQLFTGPLSDQIGRRPVLLGGLLLHAVASFGCALAESAWQLLLLRLVQALGGCVAPVIVRGYIRDVTSGHHAARALSLLMATTLIVPLLAPALGGVLVEASGWRATFVTLGLAGATACLVAWRSFPETARHAGGPVRWRDLLLLAGFGAVLRDPVAWRYVGAMTLSGGGLFAYLAASPFVFITWFGVPADRFFLVFGANVLAIAAGGFLNARVVARVGSEGMFVRGLALQLTAALALCAVAWLVPASLPAYAAVLLLYLAGIQVVGTNASACTLERFPQAAGTAAAFAGTSQFAFGAAVSSQVGHVPLPPPQALALVVVLCTAAGAAVAAIRRPQVH